MEYLDQYVKEETSIWYNSEDPDLAIEGGIEVRMPSVESFFEKPWLEAIKEIDGYGLPPEKQKFDTYRDGGLFKLPPKLANIEENMRRKYNIKDDKKIYTEDIFDEIESNPLFYKDEIEWMKVIIKRSRQGYWCFIKGRPTYIEGWHFTYLNYWIIDNDRRRDRLPDYRDVDRRIFHFFKWAYTTTETNFKYKATFRKRGEVRVKYFNNLMSANQYCRMETSGSEYFIDDNGGKGFKNVEMDFRTVLGVVFPKRRRVGATFMGAHVGTRVAIDNSMGTFAIQALTEETATKDVYQGKILKSWYHYPFFFKPTANPSDTNALVFTKKGATNFGDDIVSHGGWIIPRSSANKAFDGNKLFFYLNDESGKKENADIAFEFADTIKNALAQGQKVHGLAVYTSTFGEFESGGGKEYFELCKQSFSHKRNDNGQTVSGLVTLFIPAYDGYDGFVDEFGYSIIEDPFPVVKNLDGLLVEEGAKSYLLKNRKFYEEQKNFVALNTEKRNNPFTLREAASKANKTNFWDISKLMGRMADLRFVDNQTRSVNLKWTQGKWSTVEIVDPPEGEEGKFILSLPPAEMYRNQFIWDDAQNSFKPKTELLGRYVLGCDPFSFNAADTTSKKKSNGGGAMFMPSNPLIDSADKSPSDHITGDFVMTYNNRTETTDEYCEDMLMAAALFGSMVVSERNVGHLITYFKANNATAFLLPMFNHVRGEFEKVVGVWTDNATKERIFSKYGDYVNNVGHRARHLELLEEIGDAQSFEDMTDLDLFAAGGMALLGAESKFTELMKRNEDKLDGGGLIEMYD
jgi:hypothetical protein